MCHRQNNGPQWCPHLVSITYGYVTLHCKRYFASVIKLADFEMGSLFSIIQVDTFYKHESLKAKKLSCIWRGRKKEGGGGRDWERGRDMQNYWFWKFRKRVISPQTQAASRSWKRRGNRFSSRASRKEGNPTDTLILFMWYMCWTSDL